MTYSKLQIQKHVALLCERAVLNCGNKFKRQVRSGSLQGLETIFDDAFLLAAHQGGWEAEKRARSSLKKPFIHRPKGRIDAVITHRRTNVTIGIEFKVCQLPRVRSGDLYDIGQLSWDYAGMEGQFDSAYCIAVLFGGMVEMPEATPRAIAKLFHNSLFTDYCASLNGGELDEQKHEKWRIHQRKIIKLMGLNEPFRAESTPNNFCKLYRNIGLAVIGLTERAAPI